MNDSELEHKLTSLRWRKPAPEFLQRTLDAALAERADVEPVCNSSAGPSSFQLDGGEFKTRPTSLRLPKSFYIPKPLRLPLALFFRFTTPDPIPPATRELIARSPVVDPAVIIAQLNAQELQLREALAALLDTQPHARPADIITPEPLLP